MDNIPIIEKEAKPIHAEGTCTYIILTLAPCKQSGGEKIKAKESATKSKIKKIELINPINFQLNKFFYKNIGKKHKWIDRLIWTEDQWIKYVSNRNVKSFVLKNKKDLVGFFE